MAEQQVDIPYFVRVKVDVRIAPGTHVSEEASTSSGFSFPIQTHAAKFLYIFLAVNKQLADKERVAAALENSHLLGVVNQCLTNREA